MKNRITTLKNRFSLGLTVASAAFLLHAPVAKAGVAADPSSLTLPDAYSWSAEKTGADSASAATALQSLNEAQAYSSLYNPAWLYDLEIFYDTNLAPPSGGYIGTGQVAGTSQPVSEAFPAAPSSASVDPLESLAYAQTNSPSYNSSWQSDMQLFLDRDPSGTKPTPADVPEPGSLPLLGTGIAVLTLILSKRRSGRTA